DEGANRFWNVLKDKNVERGEFLQPPEGIHFLGDKDEVSILYIRKCYRDSAKIAFDKKRKKDSRISGNPDNNVFCTSSIKVIELYQKNSNTRYIIDGKKPVKANTRTILLCSPRKDIYREFDKFRFLTIRIIPVLETKRD
ncbi:5544_t:CDS:2, partial [Funneliformis caledonium]